MYTKVGPVQKVDAGLRGSRRTAAPPHRPDMSGTRADRGGASQQCAKNVSEGRAPADCVAIVSENLCHQIGRSGSVYGWGRNGLVVGKTRVVHITSSVPRLG